MSKVTEFFEALSKDRSMQEELAKASEAIKDEKALTASVVKFATDKGFSFTAEELDAFYASQNKSTGELSDDDLSGVAGGTSTAETLAESLEECLERLKCKCSVLGFSVIKVYS